MSSKKQALIVYIVLTVVTIAVFWQVSQYGFVFDDMAYITGDSQIQSGITLDGFRWAFSTRYGDLWNPMIWLSFMFDYQLYDLNASGYHLTNLILHILSTLLLFWLFEHMTGAIWKSAFVAAFFALHPLHVESVAWIAERKDVLSACFWMFTLCLYVNYTEKPVLKRYLPVLFSFALALMSKPMVVTLPIIMILLDYWPLNRLVSHKTATNLTDDMPVSADKGKEKTKSEKETLKNKVSSSTDRKLQETRIAGIIPLWQLWEKIPFFVLSAVIAIITLYNPNQPKTSLKGISLGDRLANAPVAFVTYLEKTFLPHDMTILYPFPGQLPVWQILGASLLIIAISAIVIIMVKRLPYLFIGWLWYAITIMPVIGIIQISASAPYAMADRYHYLPSIGISVMLAWGVSFLFEHEGMRKKILSPISIAALSIMAILTWQQCGYWENSEKLWNHALQVTKDNAVAHNNFGFVLAEKGKYQEAIDHYNEAIRLKPDYILAYNNRGNAYVMLGQRQHAIENFSEAIRLQPNDAFGYYDRGYIYNIFGQFEQAIDDFNKAIRLKPDYADAFNNRGMDYAILGRYQSAIEDFNKAISLKKDYADAYGNRAIMNIMQGRKEVGCYDAQKACALGNCKTLDVAKGKGDCR
ncbi:MAG TPA: tetratricopeptide repeat protein [Smithella sp.]|nr:tetratricopeptide repeat protein [Smithella sp.]